MKQEFMDAVAVETGSAVEWTEYFPEYYHPGASCVILARLAAIPGSHPDRRSQTQSLASDSAQQIDSNIDGSSRKVIGRTAETFRLRLLSADSEGSALFLLGGVRLL